MNTIAILGFDAQSARISTRHMRKLEKPGSDEVGAEGDG